MRTRAVLFSCALFALACGTEDPIAIDEPIVVHQADFKGGALPGAALEPVVLPAITSYAVGFGVLRPGTANAQISGRADKSAYSVGVRIDGLGSGYWVKPVGSEDPINAGELQWQLTFDAASEIEAGNHQLELVAFDGNGNAGSKVTVPVCIASELPDNLNVCNPTTPPPYRVASLSWNMDSDLDLTVVAPDGTTYGRSNRSLTSGSTVLARLDGDGVSGCLADGKRRENFVWNEPSLLGTWALYANLFDACGKQSVTFDLTLHERRQNPDGTFALVPIETVHGQFVRAQQNGGAGNPLFVSEITF